MAYVDTEKLKRNIRVNLMPNVDVDGTVTVENAERYLLNLIDKTSTADVVEVKHGEWKIKCETYKFLDEADEEFFVECPLCHRVEWIPFQFDEAEMLNYAKKHYPYCHCGAKMDGGKK